MRLPHLTRIVLGLGIAAGPVQLLAQECNAILNHGVFDYAREVSNTEFAMQYADWACEQHFGSVSDMRTKSTTAGVKVLGIGGGYSEDQTDDQFRTWYDQMCHDTNRRTSFANSTAVTLQTANPAIVQAWTSCVNAPGFYTGLRLGPSDNEFSLHVRYVSSDAAHPSMKITSVVYDKTRLSIAPSPLGKRVGRTGIMFLVTRRKDTGGIIVVNGEGAPAIPAVSVPSRWVPGSTPPRPPQWTCTDAPSIVDSLYTLALERPDKRAEEPARSYKAAALVRGEKTVRAILLDIALSKEFSDHNIAGKAPVVAVRNLYTHLLARDGEADGIAGNVAALAEKGPTAVIRAFVDGPEYTARFGQYKAPTRAPGGAVFCDVR